MSWFTNFFGSKKPNIKDLSDVIKIRESQKNFTDIAHETIAMTNSVTRALKGKIEDYENQIESVSHMMSDALLMTDNSGRITSTNERALELFNITSKEAVGMSIVTLLRLPEYFVFEDFIKESLYQSSTIAEDFIIRLPNEETIYTDISVASVFTSNDTNYFIIIIRDVTERIEDLQKIHENEQRFRIFEEVSMESIVIHNTDSIMEVNDQFLELSGYSRQEILGLFPSDFVADEDKDRVSKLESSKEGGKIDFKLKTKDKGEISVSMNSRLIPWDEDTVRINVIHDISVYKTKEEMLEAANLKYSKILDNNIDILCCYNSDLIITYVNQTFAEYFGLDRDKVIGQSILKYIPSEDHQMFISNAENISEENPVKRSLYRVNVNGRERWQDWIDRGIINDDGNITEFQAVSRDVTSYLNARIKMK